VNDFGECPVDQSECGRRQRIGEKVKQQRPPAIGHSEDAERGNHENQKREKRQKEVVGQLRSAAEDVIGENLPPGLPGNLLQRRPAQRKESFSHRVLQCERRIFI